MSVLRKYEEAESMGDRLDTTIRVRKTRKMKGKENVQFLHEVTSSTQQPRKSSF